MVDKQVSRSGTPHWTSHGMSRIFQWRRLGVDNFSVAAARRGGRGVWLDDARLGIVGYGRVARVAGVDERLRPGARLERSHCLTRCRADPEVRRRVAIPMVALITRALCLVEAPPEPARLDGGDAAGKLGVRRDVVLRADDFEAPRRLADPAAARALHGDDDAEWCAARLEAQRGVDVLYQVCEVKLILGRLLVTAAVVPPVMPDPPC
mmetsp:Transcript_18867/g.63764  ORF Transcript_18867/g.63764 Transcript_18867/m.63764 type:complete len:208 (-) Transcript_18867:778-1401(-)